MGAILFEFTLHSDFYIYSSDNNVTWLSISKVLDIY